MSGLSVAELVAYLERGGLPVDHRPGENGLSTLCQLCPGSVMWTEKLQRFVCDRQECPGHENPSLHADAFHFKCESDAFARSVETQSSVEGVVEGVPGANPPRALAPGTLRRCDLGEMLAVDPEPVDWLAEGVVARGYLSLLVGREKTGKSLLALALSARCAEGGGTIAGIECAPARVLYVDCENGSREIHRRIRALGLSSPDRIEVFEGVGFNIAKSLDDLDAVIADSKPDLVWLDSWRSMWVGDENSAQEASQVLDPLRELIRRHNVGAGLLHHANKLGQYRGSTAVGASVESIIEFSKADEDDDRRRRRLRNSACRFEQEADDRWMRIEADRARGLLLIDECEPYQPTARAQREAMSDRLLAALNGQPTTCPAVLEPLDESLFGTVA